MSPGFRVVAWRAMLATCLAAAVLLVILVGAFAGGYFKLYHVQSEAMAPTLERSDRILAYMNRTGSSPI